MRPEYPVTWADSYRGTAWMPFSSVEAAPGNGTILGPFMAAQGLKGKKRWQARKVQSGTLRAVMSYNIAIRRPGATLLVKCAARPPHGQQGLGCRHDPPVCASYDDALAPGVAHSMPALAAPFRAALSLWRLTTRCHGSSVGCKSGGDRDASW